MPLRTTTPFSTITFITATIITLLLFITHATPTTITAQSQPFTESRTQSFADNSNHRDKPHEEEKRTIIHFHTSMVNGATRDSIHEIAFHADAPIPRDATIGFGLQNPSGACEWAIPARLYDQVQGLFAEASLYESDCQVFERQYYEQRLNPMQIQIRVYAPDDPEAPFRSNTCSIQFKFLQPLFPDQIVLCYVRVSGLHSLENTAVVKAIPENLYVIPSMVIIPVISLEVRPELDIEVMPPGWSYDNDKTRFDLIQITVTKVPALGALIPLDLSIIFDPKDATVQLPPNANEYIMHQILEERPAIHCNKDTRLFYNTHQESSKLFLYRSFKLLKSDAIRREHCYTFINLGQRFVNSFPRTPLHLLQGKSFHFGQLRPPIRNQPIFKTHGRNTVDLFPFKNAWGSMKVMPSSLAASITIPPEVTMELNVIGLSNRGETAPVFQFIGFSSTTNTTMLKSYTRYFADSAVITYDSYLSNNLKPLDTNKGQLLKPKSSFSLTELAPNSPCVTVQIKWTIPLKDHQLEPFALDFVLDGHPLTFIFAVNYAVVSQVSSFNDYSMSTLHTIHSIGFPFAQNVPNAPRFVPYDQRSESPTESESDEKNGYSSGHPGRDFIITEDSGMFSNLVEKDFPIFSDCDIYLTDGSFKTDSTSTAIRRYTETPYVLDVNFKREKFTRVPSDQRQKVKLSSFRLPKNSRQYIAFVCQTKLRQPQRVNQADKDGNMDNRTYPRYNDANNGPQYPQDSTLYSGTNPCQGSQCHNSHYSLNINTSYGQNLSDSYDNRYSPPTPHDPHPVPATSSGDSPGLRSPNDGFLSDFSVPEGALEYLKPPISLQSIYFSMQVNFHDEFGHKISTSTRFTPPMATTTNRIGKWKTYGTASTLTFLAYYSHPIYNAETNSQLIDGIIHSLKSATYFSTLMDGTPIQIKSDMFDYVTRKDLYYMQAGRYPNHFDNAFFPNSYNPFDTTQMCRGLESFSYIDPYCRANELISLSTPSNAARIQFSIPVTALSQDGSWQQFVDTRFRPHVNKSTGAVTTVIAELSRGSAQLNALLGPLLSDFNFESGIYPLPVGAQCTRSADCLYGSTCWNKMCRQTNRLGLEAIDVAQFLSNPNFMDEPYKAINHTDRWYLGGLGLCLLLLVLWTASFLVILWCLSCWWTGECCPCLSKICSRCDSMKNRQGISMERVHRHQQHNHDD